MKIVSFSITNYRSITTAHKISLGNYTVLLGKNNEGKSNISNALNLAMNILVEHSRKGHYRRFDYLWSRDFPIQLQSRVKSLQSRFRLEFLLNDEELEDFYECVGSRLNGNIVIEIIVGPDNRPEIKVPKQGKNASALTRKSDIIARFISERISVSYIPAIRTENSALREIRQVVSEHLDILEENEDYIKATQTIRELQQSILDEISESIKTPLQEFMPKINEIKLRIPDESRRDVYHRGIDIIIDDGIPTNIEYKGDGIKSLMAIALLKERALRFATPVIIIEEPESHLHPEAINQLNLIIESLADNNQVIVTTHNPLFVIRSNISQNIIINDGTAKPARDMKEIREVLGIKASDNLINSKYTLIVEGDDDKKALLHILPKMSEKIAKALKNNTLTIQELDGASNLSYKLNILKSMLYTYVILLDDDDAGRNALDKAQKDNLIKTKDVTLTTCIGMSDAEFEDCIQPNVYIDKFKEEYNVDLSLVPEFKKNCKWSNRVRHCFKRLGKPWSDQIEQEIKSLVVSEIQKRTRLEEILVEQKSQFLVGLVTSIENMMND